MQVPAKDRPGYGMPFVPPGARGDRDRSRGGGSAGSGSARGDAGAGRSPREAGGGKDGSVGGGGGGADDSGVAPLKPLPPRTQNAPKTGRPSKSANRPEAPSAVPAPRSGNAAAAVEEPPEEELVDDYWTTKLPPPKHIQSHHIAEADGADRQERENRTLLLILLQILALLGAVYVFKYSKLPWIVGLRRKYWD